MANLLTAAQELERLHSNREQGRADGLGITLHVNPGPAPDEALNRLLEVIGAWIAEVAKVEAEGLPWPEDDQWRHALPQWFLQTFAGHTPEQIHASDWLWDYGSWLDSMHDRVWRWWGYRRLDNELTIELQLESWPYSIGALEYVVKVAGGEVVSVEE